MTPLDAQLRALQAVLSARETFRAARADFAAAFRAAKDAGVSDEVLADELLRDSAAHGEIEPLVAIIRDLIGPLGQRPLEDAL